MASRRLPRTVEEILDALRNAFNKSETFTDKTTMAFSQATYTQLIAFLPNLETEVSEAQAALTSQAASTRAKFEAFDRAGIFVSHFFQSFNNGIIRGMFPATDRPFYGIDINDTKVPVISNESDLQTWALRIKNGDADRVTAGGKLMAMPTAAEVDGAYTAYTGYRQTQTGLKDAYDSEQEDVHALLDEARLLVKDIWDEVEFTFRHDEASSLRRKAREWGVVYVENTTGTGGEEQTLPLTGTVEPKTSATIMEGGFDVNTMFVFTNTGTVSLNIYTAKSADDPVPGSTVELPAGAQKEIFASELGAETNTFLMVYNPDDTTQGSWEVELGNEG